MIRASTKALLLAATLPMAGLFGDPAPQKGPAILVKADQWGAEKHGYQTQLIPVTKEFTLGKPMIFSLVMKNASAAEKSYDSQGVAHGCFVIQGPPGSQVIYKAGAFQTGGAGRPIAAGEVVCLFQDRDITQEYVIDEPGDYTIQFREGDYGMSKDSTFPASNTLTFKVLPGKRDDQDALIRAVKGGLPEGWDVSASWAGEVTPSGRAAVKGFGVMLTRHPASGLKKDVLCIPLWKTEAAADEKEAVKSGNENVSEHLGQNGSQHVYALIRAEVEKSWPTVREDLKKTLGLGR